MARPEYRVNIFQYLSFPPHLQRRSHAPRSPILWVCRGNIAPSTPVPALLSSCPSFSSFLYSDSLLLFYISNFLSFISYFPLLLLFSFHFLLFLFSPFLRIHFCLTILFALCSPSSSPLTPLLLSSPCNLPPSLLSLPFPLPCYHHPLPFPSPGIPLESPQRLLPVAPPSKGEESLTPDNTRG